MVICDEEMEMVEGGGPPPPPPLTLALARDIIYVWVYGCMCGGEGVNEGRSEGMRILW